MIKNKRIRKSKNFDELLDAQYGKIGTKKRDEFETRAQYFVISEMLKDARREANLTQEQLADKSGQRKAISPDWRTEVVIYNFPLFTEFLKMDWGKKLV